jgi:hypothetical protein
VSSWWIIPLWKTLHYLAISALAGIVGVVDLRILGVAKGLPLRPLQRLMPWAGVAFAAAAVTGVVLLRLNPSNSLGPPLNVAFAAKILFLAVIGLNDILYFATGLKRQADGVGAGEDASSSAKIVAGVSLALWTGVVLWSRMLTFLAGAI